MMKIIAAAAFVAAPWHLSFEEIEVTNSGACLLAAAITWWRRLAA
jgi:hypothetical protein